MWVDYRNLNVVTVRDANPFPSILEVTYPMLGAMYFTTLDDSRDYFQIEMHPADVQNTAFTCHRVLFDFVRMPFGLSNSPSTYQRMMDITLGDAKHKFALWYLVDVTVFSSSFEEHITHLRIVLERMRASGLTVHPRKIETATDKIDLL